MRLVGSPARGGGALLHCCTPRGTISQRKLQIGKGKELVCVCVCAGDVFSGGGGLQQPYPVVSASGAVRPRAVPCRALIGCGRNASKGRKAFFPSPLPPSPFARSGGAARVQRSAPLPSAVLPAAVGGHLRGAPRPPACPLADFHFPQMPAGRCPPVCACGVAVVVAARAQSRPWHGVAQAHGRRRP